MPKNYKASYFTELIAKFLFSCKGFATKTGEKVYSGNIADLMGF